MLGQKPIGKGEERRRFRNGCVNASALRAIRAVWRWPGSLLGRHRSPIYHTPTQKGEMQCLWFNSNSNLDVFLCMSSALGASCISVAESNLFKWTRLEWEWRQYWELDCTTPQCQELIVANWAFVWGSRPEIQKSGRMLDKKADFEEQMKF